MSNKTIALLGAGFIATLFVGVLLGIVIAKTILAPTIAITRDDVFDSMQFMVDEDFQTGMMLVEAM